MADYYEGFYHVNDMTVFISEEKYWNYVKLFHLPEHSHNLNELSGCLYRQLNYICIEKTLNKMHQDDPRRFEFFVYFFQYTKKEARLLISDFLTKYMYATPNSYIDFEKNTGELPFPYGNDFNFCIRNPNQAEQQFNIKIDNIFRLVGSPDHFTIVFDNGCAYDFTKDHICVSAYANYHDNIKDEDDDISINDSDNKSDASLSESMIGDSWHAKGRVMIAIGAIIVGALLAFIMK